MIKLYDERIKSWNVVSKIKIGTYISLSRSIISNNDYQRKRVKGSSSVYNLLRVDLIKGCIIPPIVLAISLNDFESYLSCDEDLIQYLLDNKSHVLILDGLQRTFTLRDLIDDLTKKQDSALEEILERELRIEVYLGIDRLGILYRMLTLNSGQTPMSSRHQIEIIYADFAKHPVHNIQLIKEVDDAGVSNLNEFKFSDVIDGFTSYMERDYLSIDRVDILDNIKSLEKFSSENSPDVFENFIHAYNQFCVKISGMSGRWEFNQDDHKLDARPFGSNIVKVFAKSQALTGFGSAVGKLVDNKELKSVAEVLDLIPKLENNSISEALDSLILNLDKVRSSAKKIGNDQRLYFHYLFRKLLSKSSETFLSFNNSVDEAYTHYERETK